MVDFGMIRRFYDKFPDTFLFEFDMFLGGGNQAEGFQILYWW